MLLHMTDCQNTDPSESSRSDQLHQLVVAHVTQKVLQTAFTWKGHIMKWRIWCFESIFHSPLPSFTSQGRQLVSSATASKSTRDGRVVKVLVYFTAELLVLISLWLLRLEDLIPNIKQC